MTPTANNNHWFIDSLPLTPSFAGTSEEETLSFLPQFKQIDIANRALL
jgi:hypothetical protein